MCVYIHKYVYINLYMSIFIYLFIFGFSRQGFSVALEPVLELAFVDQADVDFTEICTLCLPSAGIKGIPHDCLAGLQRFLHMFMATQFMIDRKEVIGTQALSSTFWGDRSLLFFFFDYWQRYANVIIDSSYRSSI